MKIVAMVLAWYFLMAGSKPVVVGPFKTEQQCVSVREKTNTVSGWRQFLLSECWSDGRND